MDNVIIRHILTHRNSSSFYDLLGLLFIEDDFGELILQIITYIVSLLDQVDALAEDVVVGDDLSELGEVP